MACTLVELQHVPLDGVASPSLAFLACPVVSILTLLYMVLGMYIYFCRIMLSDPTLHRITSTGSYPPADECMRYILFVMERSLSSVGHMTDDDERVFNLKRIWPTYELPRIHLGGQYKIFGDGFARDLITLDPKIRTFICSTVRLA